MKGGPLRAALEAHRRALAAAAQRVLDDWQQDDEGIDEVFGSGGACDAIAGAFEDVLHFTYVDAGGRETSPSFMDGGQDGDDHAWLIVYDDYEAVALDIPPYVYETGGGYNWRKIPGVRISPADIVIEPMRRSDIQPDDDY